ncbi:hypothetical protein FOXG_21349 [Fusarium oxysporum f. sp. lycopersici 4287]|uniref:Uncharacterized protein n=1 Tax=Fusarium oxysporum f. sp. lycopersici (strain 4287 / CBS 123668 / FGSC 9935 / NRRL 34936) TaxID=426428 RepID=A0A0J9VXK5_FUSO4|nr:hypothetical protein FOXG_20959 [Fusarium oxysporum f. sp. lycopersici 4287]XP_018253546.1 hypothetical protein FOXG_21349 [Fusarium oxysporum f. sp. lycopersici 4287]EWZ79274.1 hypothetical protein FOWG_16560 [Fusarium oxysporum f. sp. lycopersici MN25]KNB13860.1 hypothetical protein FOXG_20959 [Fusarium oxysporum f. sp. lycopersici 4287]KNB15501.1 hypothetical protein FOXG_21349 [Fusarium oxysporum f. sp. lycopersici 4287]
MYRNAEKAPKHTRVYPEPANTGGSYGLFSNGIESRQKKPQKETAKRTRMPFLQA